MQTGRQLERPRGSVPVIIGEAGDLDRESFPEPGFAVQGGDRVEWHGCQEPPLRCSHVGAVVGPLAVGCGWPRARGQRVARRRHLSFTCHPRRLLRCRPRISPNPFASSLPRSHDLICLI
jgi:hypothetical protein